jgi:Helicase conserved C-terminal domain/DEAD/DEAH box helicase
MSSRRTNDTTIKALPSADDDLRGLLTSMKESGAFDQIKHLKTHKSIPEFGTAILSTTPSCVIGGKTGSGKTVGAITVLATILHQYECPHIATAYVSIPLRKGVTGAYAYANDSILTRDQKATMGWACGGEVGYRNHHKVRICTTGHVFNRLARILVSSNRDELNNLLIVVDEAHTPTSENYLLIALCLYIQEEGYSLKLVIMSATLDSAPLLEEFDACPKVELEGHLYNTEIVHLPSTPDEKNVNQSAIREIQKYTRMGHNILCFVAGESDIQAISKGLESDPTLDVCGLISNMPKEEMDLAFDPPPVGKRKVILSTNIAESSVTIPNVDVVIDTGYEIGTEKPTSGRGTIYVKRMISLASATQRAGRVGRVCPGINVRLWSSSHEYSMQLHSKSDFYSTDPDIQVMNLISLGLDSRRITRLTALRHSKIITRLSDLKLIERPDFDADWEITSLGSRVLLYKTTLDTSVAFAHLEESDNNTVKVVGAYILSLIEGSNGYLPFWVSREKRSEIVQTGYDDSDFGAFKGADDLETFFLIFFGEDGLLQHRAGKASFAGARSFRDVSKVRSDWTKKMSMNLKQIKSAMRIFQQSISNILRLRRDFRLPDVDCLRMIDKRIFDPTEYDFIDSILNEVRQHLATAFVGEMYTPAMVSAGRDGSEPGYTNRKYGSHRLDKKRSYSRLSEHSDPKSMPRILPFNIAITQRGARFISALMIDPRDEADIDERESKLDRMTSFERDIALQIYSRFGTGEHVDAMIERAVESMMRFGALDAYDSSYGASASATTTTTTTSIYASSYTPYSPPKPKNKPIHIAQPQNDVPEQGRRFVVLKKSQFTQLGGWA